MNLFFLIFLFILTGCNAYHSKVEAPAPPAQGSALDYATVYASLFQPYCVRCHGLSGGYSVETHEQALAMVKPFDAASSTLCQVLRDGAMPPRDPMPSSDLITMACDWIDQGAL